MPLPSISPSKQEPMGRHCWVLGNFAGNIRTDDVPLEWSWTDQVKERVDFQRNVAESARPSQLGWKGWSWEEKETATTDQDVGVWC